MLIPLVLGISLIDIPLSFKIFLVHRRGFACLVADILSVLLFCQSNLRLSILTRSSALMIDFSLTFLSCTQEILETSVSNQQIDCAKVCDNSVQLD